MDNDLDEASVFFKALVTSLGGSVLLLQCVAVMLLVVLAAVGYRKGHSVWSALEMVILSAGYVLHMRGVLQLHVSFPAFLLSKLLASTACFGAETLWRANAKLALPQLSYLMGIRSDWWHAGVTVGAKYYHSALPLRNVTTATDDIDPSYELTPQVAARPPRGTHTIRTVGVAFGDIDDTTILQRLALSGRCHDWAGNSVYTLSADKFMSYSLIAWLRWLNWVGAGFFFVFALQGLSFARAAVDVLAIAFTLLDVINMRSNQLEANRRQASVAGHVRSVRVELVKLALLLTFYVTFCSYCPRTLLHLEFHLYLATSWLLSTYLHFVYFPSRIRSAT
jgi:hypothetical protein